MARKSSVRKLPDELRQEIDRLLMDGRHTLDQIVAHLRKLGCAEVSRSALGRYAQSFEEVAARLRESREMADSVMAELGPAATEGKQGRLLVEIMRKITCDTLLPKLAGDVVDTKDLTLLARAIKDMAQASRCEQDYETRIREQARKEAAEAADHVAKKAGMSDEARGEIRRMLGIPE